MVRRRSRRGQTASSAAILIAIIGALLVGYILFMPPAEREKLLFSDTSGSGGGSGSGSGGYGSGGGYGGQGVFTQYGAVLIFRETPGTLRLQKSTESDHNIPTATIFTAINTQEIKRIDSAIVKNAAFARRSLDIPFDAYRRGSGNFILSFNVDEASENPLRVLINNHLIYERPIAERSPPPIPLPVDYLVDGTNHIVIEVDDAGLSFWKSNSYLLHNILITADVVDDRGAVATQMFNIDEEELGGFDGAQLQFVPECDPKKAGRLIVHLNGQVVLVGVNETTGQNITTVVPNVLYSGYPDCGVLFKTDVAKTQLRVGENQLLFASEQGSYVVDRIKLAVKLKQNDYPVYYFNLPREMYDTLAAGRGQLRITLTFADYRNQKTGEVVVNGFVQSFSTQEYGYQAVIDPGILTPGPNTIMVAPHVDKLDVAELKIELV